MIPHIPASVLPFFEQCRSASCPQGWASWSAGLFESVPADFAWDATCYAIGRLYDVCCTQQSSSELKPLVRSASDERRALWQTWIGGLIVIPPVLANPLFQCSLRKFVANVRHSTEDLTIDQIHTMLLFLRLNYVEYIRALSYSKPQDGEVFYG